MTELCPVISSQKLVMKIDGFDTFAQSRCLARSNELKWRPDLKICLLSILRHLSSTFGSFLALNGQPATIERRNNPNVDDREKYISSGWLSVDDCSSSRLVERPSLSDELPFVDSLSRR
jgi:hypothetical protein